MLGSIRKRAELRGLGTTSNVKLMDDSELSAKLLKQVPIFQSLDEVLLQDLASHTRTKRFKTRQTLFHEGDPGQTLYIVVSGQVLIQRDASTGEPVYIARRGAGEHIGELALIDGKPRMADAVVAEQTVLLMLDRIDFLKWLESSPHLAIAIISSLAERLREAADLLESHQAKNVSGRVAQLLLHLMDSHGSAHPSGGICLGVRQTHLQIAHQVGARRESITRVIANLRKSGILHTEGRILVVLNPKKLRKIAED